MTVQTAEAVPAADLERLAVDTVRTLAMDTIHKAGSGSGRRGQELAAGCRHDAAGGDRRDEGGDQREGGDGISGRAWGP